MPDLITDFIQDHLKVIYELTETGEAASNTALAVPAWILHRLP